jgi:hypothetical protein
MFQGTQSEGCEGRKELKIRVAQWIRDSKPPSVRASKCSEYGPISEDNFEAAFTRNDYKTAMTWCVLYHPDFEDWNTVQQRATMEYLSIESPFKVLNDATELISNLFKTTFES